jgi:hypothetical protein
VSDSLTSAGTATKKVAAADPVSTRRMMRRWKSFITTANRYGHLPISMVDLETAVAQ